MDFTTDIHKDENGTEFQFQVKGDRLKIRINKEQRYDAVSVNCFSMKRHGTMSFSKLYNSNGHFIKLKPHSVIEILRDVIKTGCEGAIEIEKLARKMQKNTSFTS